MTSTTAPATSTESGITVVVNQAAAAAAPGRRIAAGAIALAVGGAALVGTGAFSSWDATASAQSSGLSAATGSAALLDANGGSFTFNGVSNLVPGDYFYRYVDVRNDGSGPSTFTGSVTASGDLAGQVTVDAVTCSGAWVPLTGACTGTISSSIGSGTPSATAVPITHGAIGTGAVNAQHVRYKFTFSNAAPAALQGKTGSLTIAVNNTLVGGNDRTVG